MTYCNIKLHHVMMSRYHVHLNAGRWARVRRAVLRRDRYRCRSCGRAGRLEVDHIRPLRAGGDPWDPGNLQTLCRSCHVRKTAAENRRPPTPAETAWRELVASIR